MVGVNRLTHICCWAHNMSIAQSQAQLSSGENRANQITFFFFFLYFFFLESPFCNLVGSTLLELQLF